MPALLASSAEDSRAGPRISTLADGLAQLNSVPAGEPVVLLLLITTPRFPLFESIVTEIVTCGKLEHMHGRSPQGSLAVCDVDMSPKPLADLLKTPKLAAPGAPPTHPLRVGLLRYRLSTFSDARGAEALAESAALVPPLLAAAAVVICVTQEDLASDVQDAELTPLQALEAAAARIAAGRGQPPPPAHAPPPPPTPLGETAPKARSSGIFAALPFGRKKSDSMELPSAASAPPAGAAAPAAPAPDRPPLGTLHLVVRGARGGEAESAALAALKRRSPALLSAFAAVRAHAAAGEGPERDAAVDRVLRALLDERALGASGRAAPAAFLGDLVSAAADRLSGAGPNEPVRAWEAAGAAWERHAERFLEAPRAKLRLMEGGPPLTKDALAAELQYREDESQRALRSALAAFSAGIGPPPHVAQRLEAKLREEAMAFRVAATRSNAARVGSGTNSAAARLLAEARAALLARAGPDGFTGLLRMQLDKDSLKHTAQSLLQGAFAAMKGGLPETARKALDSCLNKELLAEMEVEVKMEHRRAVGAAIAAVERAAAMAESAMAKGHDRLVERMPMQAGQVRHAWAVETSGASESAPPSVRPNTARQIERLNLPPVQPGQANGVQTGLCELARIYRECFHVEVVKTRAKERIQRVEGLARAAGRRLQATNTEVARAGFAEGVQRAEAAVRPLGEEAGSRVLEDAVAQLRATYEPFLGPQTIDMGSKGLHQRVRAAWKARAAAGGDAAASMRAELERIADEAPTPPQAPPKEEEVTKAAGVVGVQLQFPSPVASPSKPLSRESAAAATASPSSVGSQVRVLAARSPDTDPGSPSPLVAATRPAPPPGTLAAREREDMAFTDIDSDF